MTNLETLLQSLEEPSPKKGKFSIFETAQVLQLIEIIRVQNEALGSVGLAKGMGSESSVFILRELSRIALAKVEEIAGRK